MSADYFVKTLPFYFRCRCAGTDLLDLVFVSAAAPTSKLEGQAPIGGPSGFNKLHWSGSDKYEVTSVLLPRAGNRTPHYFLAPP